MKKILLAIVIILLVSGLGVWAWYRSAVNSAVAPAGTEAKVFVVEKGEGAAVVAEHLRRDGLISSVTAFGYLFGSQWSGQ
jgi:cell division protein YceG involved in septum cleavage